jgi:hypothetical protein
MTEKFQICRGSEAYAVELSDEGGMGWLRSGASRFLK